MILLSRGLTKVTASLALLILTVITSMITWSLITTAGSQININNQNMMRIEAVIYDRENRKLILNIRTPKEVYEYLNVTLHRTNNGMPYKLTIGEVMFKEVNSNLITINLKFDEEFINGNYCLKLEVQNKTLEYKFKI